MLFRSDRIREIRELGAKDVPEVFRDFFWKTADFICMMLALRQEIQEDAPAQADMEILRRKNRRYYEDILPGQYATSYANPAYASAEMGKPWYLTAAPAADTALLGKEVTALNGRPMDEVVDTCQK